MLKAPADSTKQLLLMYLARQGVYIRVFVPHDMAELLAIIGLSFNFGFDMFELIKRKLGPLFEGVTPLESLAWHEPCDCCGRSAALFDHQGFVFDGSSLTQVLCDACSLFVLPNEKMGYELGSTPYRLNSFKGGYLIIPTNDDPCEIWLGGKYVTRFINTPSLICKPISGNAANLALLEDTRDKLVISLSPRREIFLRNLRQSNQDHLFIASEQGCLHVRLQDVPLFDSLLSAPKKKQNEEIAYALSSVKRGQNTQRVHKILEEIYETLSEEQMHALTQAANHPDSLIFIVSALKTREVKK